MSKKSKTILFIILLVFLWLPAFQELTHIFKEPVLNGTFNKPKKPEFSLSEVKSTKYQKCLEDYLNYDFGFRGLMVKIKNSWEYLLFRQINVSDQIEGKDGYIYCKSSIDRTLGKYYNGFSKNNNTALKIQSFKKGIEKHGGHFFVVLAPSKTHIIPESLPDEYQGVIEEKNDYIDLVSCFNKYKVPIIDFCSYFQKIRNTCNYPLFTRKGMHWSVYGASIAQDSILNYIQSFFPDSMPRYERKGVEWSDTAREPEIDLENLQNLIFSLEHKKFVYPKIEMINSTLKNKRPKVIIIGDSFYWQIVHLETLKYIFNDDSRFWYYFSKSFPLKDLPSTDIKDIDVIKELESADFVFIVGSIGTLGKFPFGVTDYYLEKSGNLKIAENIQEAIKHDPYIMDSIRINIIFNEMSIENSINLVAADIYRDRRIFKLKASNNKFICADASINDTIIANRDKADKWETFNLLMLGENRCVIYSYKNKFLSVNIKKTGEVTANIDKAQAWEVFSLEKLDSNHIVLKAINNKYLSLDNKTLKLFANKNTFGKNEIFEIIIK